MQVNLRKSHIILLKVIVHGGALLPFFWLYWAIPRGQLGGDPVPELIHFLGKGALHLLILTLCVSPLAKFLSAGQLIRLRRPLGLWCFVWASCHFAAWLSLDWQFAWAFIGEEIVKRTYILLGVICWITLLALAITSLPNIMRRMGRRWKQLHSLIYTVIIMAVIHYWWSLKSGWIEPALYLTFVLALLWPRRQKLLHTIKK